MPVDAHGVRHDQVGGIERGDVSAILPTSGSEMPSDVDGVFAHRDGPDRTIRGWVPVGGNASGSVERRQVGATLTSDGRKIPSHVNRVATHRDRVGSGVGIRTPGRGGAC